VSGASQSERLPSRFAPRELLTRLIALAAALAPMIVAGWKADAGRRILFVPALMGVGIGIYFALPFEPSASAAFGAASLAAGCFLLRRVAANGELAAALGLVAAIAVGAALIIARAQTNTVDVLTRETRMLALTGRVANLEPTDRGRTRVLLAVHSTKPALRGVTPKHVRISVSKAPVDLLPGDWIAIRGTLRPLPAPVAPGSYDFGRKLWFDGIGAVGFSLGTPTRIAPLRPDTFAEQVTGSIQSFRHAVSDRIRAAMSERTGPIAAAFLTGERGLISEEDNEAMRDSSLAHLLSISGLHMVLAGFGFFAALRLIAALIPPIALNYPVKKCAAAAALLASFGYLLLSGASVPTQRSFVMIAVALVAIIFDRSALNMRTVAIAAALILALSPESWIDPSFQMSFAAVVALIAAYEWWNERRIPDAEQPSLVLRAARMVGAAAVTSLIAGLATAPFAAFHFNRFADYGVAANVMVMPIVSFVIMPAGVLALLLMPLGLEWLPLAVMEKGINAMLAVAHWVASWPGATQAVAAWPVSSLMLIVAGGLWLALWQASWRWLGLAPAAFGLVALLFVTPPDIIVAGDADNVAVRDAEGKLHLLSSKRGRFDAEIWLRRDGDPREIADLSGADDAFACDAQGCLASIAGRSEKILLIANTPEAMLEDCATATVVVYAARGWTEPCAGPQLVVTQRLLKDEGAIEARLVEDRIEWTSVARDRGDRPWAATPETENQ
jgi:competence protein ComEC